MFDAAALARALQAYGLNGSSGALSAANSGITAATNAALPQATDALSAGGQGLEVGGSSFPVLGAVSTAAQLAGNLSNMERPSPYASQSLSPWQLIGMDSWEPYSADAVFQKNVKMPVGSFAASFIPIVGPFLAAGMSAGSGAIEDMQPHNDPRLKLWGDPDANARQLSQGKPLRPGGANPLSEVRQSPLALAMQRYNQGLP